MRNPNMWAASVTDRLDLNGVHGQYAVSNHATAKHGVFAPEMALCLTHVVLIVDEAFEKPSQILQMLLLSLSVYDQIVDKRSTAWRS